ncbi:uncharacterized protein SRS1_10474 [Sporisorium reilianum f. sp. reilianum]|uniref:Uncharacterized protein n=1 Tax=Sporisorium reilianum f. sp. reilianum TaxID=72559 RepID=A0A2N8U9L0_9BASI|nr:uncharacterized protein SRS1_10474 [Sporisorium reilianum f. sp. reilianum]
MKSTLIWLLALALLSLCARTAPLPSPSSSHRHIPHSSAPRTSLAKRGEASALESAAESAISTAKKKDWKRPIVISISAIGLVMTIGWNYISAQSFFSNRAKYYKEKKRLEVEKRKPPPQVGDMVCTVETYYTPDQVEARKPSQVRTPCYVMGQQGGAAQQSTAQQNTAQQQTTTQPQNPTQQGAAASEQPASVEPQPSGNVVPQQPEQVVSPRVGVSSDSLRAMLSRGRGSASGTQTSTDESQSSVEFAAPDDSSSVDPASSSSSVAPASVPAADEYGSTRVGGPLHKRGLTTEGAEAAHGIEEAAHEIEEAHNPPSPSPPSSTSTSPSTSVRSNENIPLLPLDSHGRTRLVSSTFADSRVARARARARPGFAVARTSHAVDSAAAFDAGDALAEGEKDKAGSTRPKGPKVWTRIKSIKKVKTEDITFGLTVLNTIGNIPSLILTTINAYYYRGNPKVD